MRRLEKSILKDFAKVEGPVEMIITNILGELINNK
jgi:hypothetical protein